MMTKGDIKVVAGWKLPEMWLEELTGSFPDGEKLSQDAAGCMFAMVK